jgi:uncharacterized membrane protein YqaE (UPF0057 family)
MKNFIKLKVAAVLGVAFIVGSCGTSNSVVNGGLISKRKHTKGFHLNLPSSNGSVLAKKEINEKNNEKTITLSDVKIQPTKESVVEANASKIVRAETFVNKEEKTAANKTTPMLISDPTKNTDRLEIKENTVKQELANGQQEMEAKKPFQKEKSKKSSSQADEILLIILAIFIPPLAVYLFEGRWTSRCTLNLILTLLCGIPGIIHAFIVILK